MEYFYPNYDFGEFIQLLFPYVPLSRSVRVVDLIHVFNNLLHQLSDAAAVRVVVVYARARIFGEIPSTTGYY